MFSLLRQSVLIFLVLSAICGLAYPLTITVIAQLGFPYQANGSLIEHDRKLFGSRLIGQYFDEPRYFWGRPSATTPAYNGAASSGSNLGPTNPAQLEAVKARADVLRQADPEAPNAVPIDLVTASGSGLDPHISPAAAEYQIRRVAKARGLEFAAVKRIVERHTEQKQLGIFGEPRVNVLQLNLELDEQGELP